jgi:hypothetical protein
MFTRHVWVLLKKNFILQRRFYWSTLFQCVLTPFVLLFLLFLLQKSFNAKLNQSNLHPTAYPMTGLDPCSNSGCITLMYTPKNTNVDSIMNYLVQNNNKRKPTRQLSLSSTVFNCWFLFDASLFSSHFKIRHSSCSGC